MKLFLFITCLTLVRGYSITTNYHEDIGIPEAQRIRQAESALDFDGARIIGGSPSALGAHPYAAGLLVNLVDGRLSMCGASLVSNTRVVTAASCWQSVGAQGRVATVVLGSTRLFSGGTRVNTSDVEVHSEFNQNNVHNNVAIITIPHVAYTANIQNIELPSGIFQSLTYSGEVATAVGFGRTSDVGPISPDPELRHANLWVIHNWDCVTFYGSEVVTANTLCTDGIRGSSTCTGDTGGPLAFTFQDTRYLIGISSFVFQNGCQAGLPAGFTRVTSYADWIRARL